MPDANAVSARKPRLEDFGLTQTSLQAAETVPDRVAMVAFLMLVLGPALAMSIIARDPEVFVIWGFVALVPAYALANAVHVAARILMGSDRAKAYHHAIAEYDLREAQDGERKQREESRAREGQERTRQRVEQEQREAHLVGSATDEEVIAFFREGHWSRRVYTRYLKTEHWQSVKQNALENAGFRCQLCAQTRGKLDVHHNSYQCIGMETLQDVIVLCRPCHKIHHGARSQSGRRRGHRSKRHGKRTSNTADEE
ncbi:MAG: hypothetical protein JXB04_13485 [Kiritimatiellae bacterium]|nr:hypothetical protein [Kiritimatiellia bacterium]